MERIYIEDNDGNFFYIDYQPPINCDCDICNSFPVDNPAQLFFQLLELHTNLKVEIV